MTKAQKRRQLAATRYDRQWFNVRFLDTPHHARVVQLGPPPAPMIGLGGRRSRARLAREIREGEADLQRWVANMRRRDESGDDIPF